MIKKFLKSATVTALGLIAAITLLVMFFTDPRYNQEEIDWCAANRPGLTMEVCAEEFGY
jgi:hypothetical protein